MDKDLKVRVWGDPVLRTKAEPVDTISDELRELIEPFVETMKKEDGIGLAANQIGIAKRFIAVSDQGNVYVLFNPEILKWSAKTEVAEEGCLSLPGLQVAVERSAKVVARGTQQDGTDIELVARGLFARVIQHEMDHLNGILIVDHVRDGDSIKMVTHTAGQEKSEYLSVSRELVIKKYKQQYHNDQENTKFEFSD